jgi:uncharacterized protein with PIN domain
MVMWLVWALVLAYGGVALVRREADRRAKLAAALQQLEAQARTRPGGAPDRPIEVVSPSEVEVAARATRCPLCGGELRVNEHAAETIDGKRLRLAYTTCIACSSSRALYFRIKVPS